MLIPFLDHIQVFGIPDQIYLNYLSRLIVASSLGLPSYELTSLQVCTCLGWRDGQRVAVELVQMSIDGAWCPG